MPHNVRDARQKAGSSEALQAFAALTKPHRIIIPRPTVASGGARDCAQKCAHCAQTVPVTPS